jgi:hypothetical protein
VSSYLRRSAITGLYFLLLAVSIVVELLLYIKLPSDTLRTEAQISFLDYEVFFFFFLRKEEGFWEGYGSFFLG